LLQPGFLEFVRTPATPASAVKHLSRLLPGLICGLAFGIAAFVPAHADDVSETATATAVGDAQVTTSTGARVDDGGLTWRGVTLYGVVDAGVANQTHGAKLNFNSPQGLNYLIAKSSNGATTSLAPNGLGPSAIGLGGDIPVSDALSAIFKLETGFDPLALRPTNGPQSLVDNNGRSLNAQTSSNDSSQAGQIFNSAAYAGVKSKDYGALTFGRQNGLLADKVYEYDPNGASYAFSAVGGVGAIRGIGDTQDSRLNSSLKYSDQTGPYRVGVQYQFSGKQYALIQEDGVSGSALEVDVGGDYGRFSADALYSHKNGAISAASLSAAQVAKLPVNSLAATVSDNTSYTLVGKYAADRAKLFAGYERIEFANPSFPLPAGTPDVGGYILSVLTQNAYTVKRVEQVYWAGVKYEVTPKLDVTGAYYGYSQNSYAVNGCGDASSSKCSGALNAVSLVAVYKLVKHWDVYSGAMWSGVKNGLASGYLNTSNLNTMVGVRFTF
jgi:predicted porin